jgi:hypothetical protein
MDAHRNGYDSFYTAGVNKMGGPIVRTGTTPKFWENYDKIFRDKPGTKTKKKTASKTTKKKPAQAKKKK